MWAGVALRKICFEHDSLPLPAATGRGCALAQESRGCAFPRGTLIARCGSRRHALRGFVPQTCTLLPVGGRWRRARSRTTRSAVA